jgi:hypothetical protein
LPDAVTETDGEKEPVFDTVCDMLKADCDAVPEWNALGDDVALPVGETDADTDTDTVVVADALPDGEADADVELAPGPACTHTSASASQKLFVAQSSVVVQLKPNCTVPRRRGGGCE